MFLDGNVIKKWEYLNGTASNRRKIIQILEVNGVYFYITQMF
jgi:hypothetical protein